jgi:hypothetical protein
LTLLTHEIRRLRAFLAALVIATVAACGGGNGAAPATITAQPASASASAGGSVTFSVSATGDGLAFQWQLSIDDRVTWVDIAGATAASYVLASVNATLNGNWYRARVAGAGGTVMTEPALLTVPTGLQSRLNGAAYYDAVANVTVLADANLPRTMPLGVPGIGSDGTMSWSAAQAWVQALNAARHLGYADWRLPVVGPINGVAFVLIEDPANPHASHDGTMDLGYNITAPNTRHAGSTATELPYVYYNRLGSLSKFSLGGAPQDNTANTNAPLINVTATPYWTGTAYGSSGAYAFNFDTGTQYAYEASTVANPDAGWHFNVLVLRTGDS